MGMIKSLLTSCDKPSMSKSYFQVLLLVHTKLCARGFVQIQSKEGILKGVAKILRIDLSGQHH